MSDKNYVVPKEGLAAALEAAGSTLRDTEWKHVVAVAVHAFIRWQSENPPIPPEPFTYGEVLKNETAVSWVKQMYLYLEPEVPEEIRFFMFETKRTAEWTDIANERIREAYRRGYKAGVRSTG